MSDAIPETPRTVTPTASTPLLSENFDRDRVAELRHAVASCAKAAGLHGRRLDDLVLAVNELVTNAVRHGGGRGRLRLWLRGRTVLCEVSDRGGGIDPDRIGKRDRPPPDSAGGRGLWLVDQLSEGLMVRSGPAGTTVRIKATIGRSARPCA